MRASQWGVCAGLSALSLTIPPYVSAQGAGRPELHEGSAVVRTENGEHVIRILCDDAARPELGFSTEPNRVTRAATGGRGNAVSLRLRSWKDTGDVLIAVDLLGVAWLPRPTSAAGVLSMDVALRPHSFLRGGVPVTTTYEMWKSGDLPDEETRIEFEADCARRDPEAPATRKLE